MLYHYLITIEVLLFMLVVGNTVIVFLLLCSTKLTQEKLSKNFSTLFCIIFIAYYKYQFSYKKPRYGSHWFVTHVKRSQKCNVTKELFLSNVWQHLAFLTLATIPTTLCWMKLSIFGTRLPPSCSLSDSSPNFLTRDSVSSRTTTCQIIIINTFFLKSQSELSRMQSLSYCIVDRLRLTYSYLRPMVKLKIIPADERGII